MGDPMLLGSFLVPINVCAAPPSAPR